MNYILKKVHFVHRVSVRVDALLLSDRILSVDEFERNDKSFNLIKKYSERYFDVLYIIISINVIQYV